MRSQVPGRCSGKQRLIRVTEYLLHRFGHGRVKGAKHVLGTLSSQREHPGSGQKQSLYGSVQEGQGQRFPLKPQHFSRNTPGYCLMPFP